MHLLLSVSRCDTDDAVFKGDYRPFMIMPTSVSTLLLASIALTAFSGISISRHTVPFMYAFTAILHLSVY